MLQSLTIKNVALISFLNLEFGDGFNVLLGETGAGKSIIFDALNFVLGSKADKTLIRSGESEMRVDVIFNNLTGLTREKLCELGYDCDELCISRTFNIDGKSSIRINGFPVILSQLKDISEVLVDSYSQHENTQLLKTKNHLILLDKFGGEKIESQKEKVKSLYNQLLTTEKKISSLGGDKFERDRRLSLLDYQIKEIEDAQLKAGEEEELSEKLKFYNSAEKIYETISNCENLLGENSNNSCINSLQQVISCLSGISEFGEISDCHDRLLSAKYELEDIYQTLIDIKANTEFDEREFEALDRRNDLIKALTKKYGGDVNSTLNYLSKAKEEYNELIDGEVIIEKLLKEKIDINNKLQNECQILSNVRKSVANQIKSKILKQLSELGMKSCSFDVQFVESKISQNGFDDVEFVFSANRGQDTKALSKTASGGELSRFMLAFKQIFAAVSGAQTLIFDEIDSGISGETGIIVGKKINEITKSSQVLCITHLPQVACFADDFFVVEKEEEKNSTLTKVKHLDSSEINYYLARMTIGDEVSDISIKQAEEMRAKTGKV